MQDCKTYSLKLFIKSIQIKSLKKGTQCLVEILKESQLRQLGPFTTNNSGQIIVNQKVQFKILSGELKRDSKCILRILHSIYKQQCGTFQFLIMNYKNYSKSSFKITHNDNNVGTIHMSINISSTQSTKQEQKELKPASQKARRKKSQEFMLESVEFQMPSINIKAPVEEIKLVCPSEAVSIKQPKSMFGAFQNSGIVINTKKNLEGAKSSDKKPLSSMGQLFQKKPSSAQQSLKIPLNENLINSCKFSPSRTVKDSRYCKQIQENLDNLSALDQQSNRLSYSRSPLKSQEAEFNIFNTLYRMKDKFQKIHEHEGILNDEEQILGPLSEVNEEGDTEDKERLISSNHNEHCYQLKSYLNSQNMQNYELGKSTIINLEVNSQCNKLDDSSRNYNRIVKTVDFRFLPSKPPLKISPCFNFKFILNNKLELREDFSPPSTNKRYMIAKVKNVSQFFPDKEDEKCKTALTQSYLNFEIEEESLKRVSYIKLNKISHLSRAADISKRRNNFLIKANEQLKISQKLAEQKLQISKKIISEKQDILNHQFQTLKEHMRIISSNLSLKNQESIKREEKIRSLQGLVQQYARDINCLKNELKCSANTIKDLKCLLALKEEAESKQAKPETSQSIKESKPTKKDLNIRTQKCSPFLDQQQKRANSTSKTFMQRKIRKNSSIQNTFNNGTYFQQVDKSADFGRSNFRKFSHSKNTSFHAIESQQYSRNCSNSHNNSKIDMVFDKLAGLFTGDSGNRLLKNL